MAIIGKVCYIQGPDVPALLVSERVILFCGARLYFSTRRAAEMLLAQLPSGYTLHTI